MIDFYHQMAIFYRVVHTICMLKESKSLVYFKEKFQRKLEEKIISNGYWLVRNSQVSIYISIYIFRGAHSSVL